MERVSLMDHYIILDFRFLAEVRFVLMVAVSRIFAMKQLKQCLSVAYVENVFLHNMLFEVKILKESVVLVINKEY